MNNQFRFTSLIPLVAMAALAGITWWLLQATLPRQGDRPLRPKEHTPDYFADKFSVSELDQSGATQYRLTAQSLIHYEDDELSELVKPAMRAFQPGKPIVTATGDTGRVNGDASIVDLYGNARIVRSAGNGDPQMQADSEHFRVLVNDDVIETEKPVKLQRGMSVMTASGMNYNNVTRVMQLFGNVKGAIAASDAGGSSPRQPG
ncbi:LPS export ABC transporter periplasmic protein LptC [bacterium M00.F.Ca.ET.228.01.1.1]|uniref:LPS export ABC transporter periplasmic protein LptC n=1 Tax=Paraburkholderia phenoliruptrix TaxID=252970 RepID=UPI0010927ABE|nr:LPS export ABC transporter periplasmic protein LptC [Paraburkholderia phenoliruptrix]TGP44614.1 LPS export ABC transporter periplasmic protein LptC [bacterium M00.F.Ca.ET.228.01.1.1]TGS02497.1 LPS export ABC transporter periplasmic protein LptC [bacterium M00.F.Ca.ET.191.01.1.1]TGU05879.1 LPS export ABC transporter periplasmic protein LptC [bacterium M00.F.Ca.ET.155.01.1.1]MBW0449151.1 LPS export ABC transporter periplasmic protein LptC [Paraburkholderia phenoliruptrix]MBW9099810.1 LPS expo